MIIFLHIYLCLSLSLCRCPSIPLYPYLFMSIYVTDYPFLSVHISLYLCACFCHSVFPISSFSVTLSSLTFISRFSFGFVSISPSAFFLFPPPLLLFLPCSLSLSHPLLFSLPPSLSFSLALSLFLSRLDIYKSHSISFSAVMSWNSLPINLRSSMRSISLNNFKRKLGNYLLSKV